MGGFVPTIMVSPLKLMKLGGPSLWVHFLPLKSKKLLQVSVLFLVRAQHRKLLLHTVAKRMGGVLIKTQTNAIWRPIS